MSRCLRRREGTRPRDALDEERESVAFRDEAAHRRGQQDGLIHSAAASSTNVHDSEVLSELLHGNETRAYVACALANLFLARRCAAVQGA